MDPLTLMIAGCFGLLSVTVIGSLLFSAWILKRENPSRIDRLDTVPVVEPEAPEILLHSLWRGPVGKVYVQEVLKDKVHLRSYDRSECLTVEGFTDDYTLLEAEPEIPTGLTNYCTVECPVCREFGVRPYFDGEYVHYYCRCGVHYRVLPANKRSKKSLPEGSGSAARAYTGHGKQDSQDQEFHQRCRRSVPDGQKA